MGLRAPGAHLFRRRYTSWGVYSRANLCRVVVGGVTLAFVRAPIARSNRSKDVTNKNSPKSKVVRWPQNWRKPKRLSLLLSEGARANE